MRRTSSWLAVPGPLAAITPAAAAVSPENAARIKADLMARTFVAKVDLYQATVFDTGALMHEFDTERTWVQFAFSKSLSPDFSERPTFEKMLTRVFDETKADAPAAQEGH